MPRRLVREVTPESLATYLAEVRRLPLLTPEEEAELGRRIRRGDEEALRKLVAHNLRFVVQIAARYQGHGLPLADLINEGNLGLLHAARKFDPERGTRFITYAVWWIRQAILHALARGGGLASLPRRQAEALPRLWQTFEALTHQKGREPTAEEVAQALHLPPEEVRDLLRVVGRPLSLQAAVNEEGEIAYLDVLPACRVPSSEEVLLRAALGHEVEQLLQRLEPREAKILRARFGFEGKPKSLAALGRELGLSRERVRQLEARARRKLRALAKEKALDDYLN
ncbi:MAG: RNA polymerase sigma factor [Candidatus Tectimicrobiota bacterium]|nr:MAG: RNA polymerase sigma factor [Candidatus Tectomicrobia bacterium]